MNEETDTQEKTTEPASRKKAAAKKPAARRRTAAKEPEKAPKKRRRSGLWYTIKDGRSMSLTFFKRNGWLILLAMVAVIWLISQRYSNQSRMEEIKGLEKELRRAESRKLDAKAEYMSLIRESRMRQLMDSNNLRISYQEQPPYILPSN